MPVRAGYLKRTAAVYSEVILAEKRGIRLVGVVFKRVFLAIGKGICGAISQGDEALIGLLYVYSWAVFVVNAHAIQHHLHLGF